MRDSVSELDLLLTKKRIFYLRNSSQAKIFMKDKKTDKAAQTKKYIYLSDQ